MVKVMAITETMAVTMAITMAEAVETTITTIIMRTTMRWCKMVIMAATMNDGGNDSNPYYDFDITKCDTYENLWMWDLSLTCDDSESFNNCECAFAEELLVYGYLTCYDRALCPSDCQICEKCLRIVGCSQEITAGAATHLVSPDNFSFFIIASAVGVLVIATVVYTRTRQETRWARCVSDGG